MEGEEKQGFDVVIGNPPYDVTNEDAFMRLSKPLDAPIKLDILLSKGHQVRGTGSCSMVLSVGCC
jgi:methylase of polypeptide subunit release factors